MAARLQVLEHKIELVGAAQTERRASTATRVVVAAAVVVGQREREGEEVQLEIREAMAPTGSKVTDLHVWQVGPGHFAVIVSLTAPEPKEPSHYKALMAQIHELSHVTVEIQRQVT